MCSDIVPQGAQISRPKHASVSVVAVCSGSSNLLVAGCVGNRKTEPHVNFGAKRRKREASRGRERHTFNELASIKIADS